MKEIIFLEPIFMHNIWGGTKLREDFGYQIEGTDVGECWGVSAHEHGDCRICQGRYAGKTLSWLWNQKPELFGNLAMERFPLLIKIIDAKEDLSVQVHPDDHYAAVHENGSLGKTECWYVLDCPEDATLVIGHNAKSKEELKAMIHHGRWKELIREIPVKKGDFIQIEPGTVHAIKSGFLILETQQNSDITYRVYDYDRLSNGSPRELHISQSIDVITVPARPAKESLIVTDQMRINELQKLIHCDYYTVYKLETEGGMLLEQKAPFLIGTILEGTGMLDGQLVKKGNHFILPADYGQVQIEGKLQMILSSVTVK